MAKDPNSLSGAARERAIHEAMQLIHRDTPMGDGPPYTPRTVDGIVYVFDHKGREVAFMSPGMWELFAADANGSPVEG